MTDADVTVVPSHGGSVVHTLMNTNAMNGGVAIKIRDLPYYEIAPAGMFKR